MDKKSDSYLLKIVKLQNRQSGVTQIVTSWPCIGNKNKQKQQQKQKQTSKTTPNRYVCTARD